LHRSPQPHANKSVLTLLINGLAAAPGDAVLVLDDYHLIQEASVHEMLSFLVAHLPPGLHLVLSSRVDPPLPLARLRTQGQLTEIRSPDLRFTLGEAATFLNEKMGLELSSADVQALALRTEGWISGLQLAALSLRNQAPERRPAFVQAFSGSHRHLIDYLAQEVLAQQPPELHDFLYQTALLDQLTAPLCDAVTGRQDSDELLRRLEQENLFLIPLDGERRWYRYHHLFREFLLSYAEQQFPDQMHDLHCWAADWYEHEGFLSHAVGQALSAGEHEWAAHLVERTAIQTLMRGQVTTVLGWLETLPDPLVRARPRLSIARAAALVIAGQLQGLETYLQDAERGIQALPTTQERQVLSSQLTVIRAYQATLGGRLSAALALTREAGDQLDPEDAFFQGIVSWLRGMTQYFAQGAPAATRAFAESVRLSQESGSTLMALLSTFAAGYMHVVQGHLRLARECFQEGLRLAEVGELPGVQDRSPAPPIGTSLVYQGLGEVAREQNDLARAEQYLARCVELAERWGNAEPLADSYVLLARIRHAQGEIADAHRWMERAEQFGRKGQVTDLTLRQVEAHRTRLWIAEANLEASTRWAETWSGHQDTQPEASEPFVLFVRGLEERTLACWYLAQGEYKEALRLLAPLRAKLQAAGWTGITIEVLALQALALDGEGQTAQALETLEHALSLAEPEGYARTFVDLGAPMARLLARHAATMGTKRAYARELMLAIEAAPPLHPSRSLDPAIAGPFEPLTAREREVLHLVLAGLSNREIADRLTITLGTAKRHVSNIYAKLEVHSRIQAVAKARELGLT
jgi:LuxR family maltose regulon positive regulatory protein